MAKFAANLTMLFNERPFLDRFAAARDAGFAAVEYLFLYEYDADLLVSRLHGAGLRQVLFNLPAGDWAGGERGTACIPGREAEFRDGVERAIRYAGRGNRSVRPGRGPRGTTAPKIVVDMSSIAPLATKRFAREIEAAGSRYLDAPVSGGEVGAKAASLTIMVGGQADTFAEVEPLFRLMGKNVTHVGANGDGQTTKVVNQIIVALTIEAVSEALVFAAKAGADPAKVRQALMGGFASSRILEVHGDRMIKRTFQPGFRIDLHQKDLGLALAGARDLGVALPATALAQQLFSACVAQGGGALDHSALVNALEMLSGLALGQAPAAS